jgi:Family of unknown function (DUF6152)
MKKHLVVFGILGILALSGTPLFAHHGFAGRYDEANPITITGTVVELQLINPHSQIIFEVKGPKGEIQRWHAELGGANAIHREGWGKDTVKAGTKITILGPAAKSGTFDMNLSHESRISLADTGKVLHDSIQTGNANAPAAGRGAAPAAAPAGGNGY